MSTEILLDLDSDQNFHDDQIFKFQDFVRCDLDYSSDQEPIEAYKNETLCATLEDDILNRKNTDIVLKHLKSTDKCHGDVLRYHSDLFERCLPAGETLTLSADIHPVVFKFLYDWMIRGSIECPQTKLLELLEAGFKLYMPILVNAIFKCMDDKSTFKLGNAIDIYFRATEKKMWGVADLVLASCRKYFLLMVDTIEFAKIKASCLRNLLSSDRLGVQSEIEVFYAVLVWLYADCKARKSQLEQVLKSVRFKLLPSEFLCNVGMRMHELDPDIADILHRVMQGTMWVQQTLNMEHGIDENIQPVKRIWIKDHQCPYKDLVQQEKQFSHYDFLKYLNSIKNAKYFLDNLEVTKPEDTEETGGIDLTEENETATS